MSHFETKAWVQVVQVPKAGQRLVTVLLPRSRGGLLGRLQAEIICANPPEWPTAASSSLHFSSSSRAQLVFTCV